VANSLYKDKDVFIRELLSNASDSLEKRRYESLKHSYAGKGTLDDSPSEIQIYLNPEKRTITFQDSGIGMTREELIENLGTIARSGSQKFLEQIKETTGKGKCFVN
jgi:HSP90 family molecular chaperone